MLMSYIWCGFLAASIAAAVCTGSTQALSAAALDGAKSAATLSLALAGPICLWCGVSRVAESAGLTAGLSRLLRPLLGRLFPDSSRDPATLGSISANVSANLFGLGNAATPLGIEAVQRMKVRSGSSDATHEMCRFIVLNTASIQLIPATVAAVRLAGGCPSPFDILPAVWITSLCSASAGLLAARLLQRLGC